MARKRLGEILVQAGVLSDAQLRAALGEQRRWGGPLGRILVDMKLVNEEAMVQALSHQLNFPTVNLDQRKIEPGVLDLVSADLADGHAVVPFNVQGKFLDVAMSDPTNLGIIDELRIRTRMNVRPYLAGPKMIERAIARYYGRGMATLHFGADGRITDMGAPAPAVGAVGGAQAPYIDIGGSAGASTPAGASSSAGPSQPSAGGSGAVPLPIGPTPSAQMRSAEVLALQERVQHLEALVARDEDVLRKLLGLFIEKGIATREEILERIK